MPTVISGGKIVALGGTRPVHHSPSAGNVPLIGTTTVTLPGGKTMVVSPAATYDAMYRRQPALYAVATLLIKGIARLPMHTFLMDADGDRSRQRAHPLAKLLRNPYKRGSAWDWKVRLAYDLMIHGKHLQVKVRSKTGTPIGLQPVPWWRVETIRDELGILGFAVHLNGRVEIVGLDDTVYYELPGGGVSPVEVLKRTLAIDEAAIDYQGAALRNGVTPRAAFSFKQVSPQDRPFVREEIEKLYTGPENAARFAILTGDASVSPIGVSAVDLALIDQRKLTREETCVAYGVSPSVVGFATDKVATHASQQEFRKQLYVDALGPILTMIEETMQAQLVDEELSWDGLFVEWTMDELLKPDLEARSRAHLMSQQSSTLTIDERRAAENKPALKIAGVTDVPLIPVNMRPAAPGMFDGEPAPATANAASGGLTDQLVLEALRAGSTQPDDPEEG